MQMNIIQNRTYSQREKKSLHAHTRTDTHSQASYRYEKLCRSPREHEAAVAGEKVREKTSSILRSIFFQKKYKRALYFELPTTFSSDYALGHVCVHFCMCFEGWYPVIVELGVSAFRHINHRLSAAFVKDYAKLPPDWVIQHLLGCGRWRDNALTVHMDTNHPRQTG